MPVGVGEWNAGVALAWAIIVFTLAASAGISYLLGCANGAVIISKYVLKDDIRGHGSGNAGLTNFYRTFGGKLTAAVLALDIVKMVLAMLVSVTIPSLIMSYGIGALYFWKLPHTYLVVLKYWVGLWCLLGHMFPVTFSFKGGKGVLSGVTLMFCLDWRMGLIALGIFLVAVFLTRYISLGSCLGAVSFPVSTWLFVSRGPVIVGMSVILAALVIFMHRGNLKRILNGTESKFSFHHKKNAG